MATFDLRESAERTADYPRAYKALKLRFGEDNFWAPLKQFCVIRTTGYARDITNTINQAVGGNCNIIVIRLAKGGDRKIKELLKEKEAREMFDAIPYVYQTAQKTPSISPPKNRK
jgi:hypothetical protein